MHIKLELPPDVLDIFQPFLIIRPSTTNPDLNLMLNEYRREFA